MLDARELRIGNWIQSDGDPSDKWQIDKIEDGYTFVEGIPLTPEILEKCGFNNVPFRENIYTTIGGGYQIAFAENRNSIFYIYIDDFKGYCYACGLLYYLHQLQNLYHALTGEELQIKDLI